MALSDEYEFVAKDADSGAWVVLDIREACPLSEKNFEKVWHKLALAVENHHKLGNTNAPNWVTWKPHEWSKKVVPGRRKFIAWDGDVLAGFLNLQAWKSEVNAQPTTYIEHLATFPGNIQTAIWSRRLKEVGIALMCYASAVGNLENAPRVALHSDEDAIGWYDGLEGKLGNLFEVRRRGVEGPHPSNRDQMYFETNEQGSEVLRRYYSHG